MRAARLKTKPGASHEITHRLGDQNFARRGKSGSASADMHSNACEIGADDLAFPSVQAAPYLKSELPHCIPDCAGAADGSSGPVESSEEAVARGVYLPAAVLLKHVADLRIKRLKQLTPPMIAKLCRALCRTHDVGKQDRSEHAIRRARLAPSRQKLFDVIENDISAFGPIGVVDAGKLYELCIGDMLRHVARVADLADSVRGPVQDQRRGADPGNTLRTSISRFIFIIATAAPG